MKKQLFPQLISGFAQLSWCLVVGLLLAAIVPQGNAADKNAAEKSEAAAAVKRLNDSLNFLASDERTGRGVGTEGIDQAADFIYKRFKELGLKTEVFGNSPYQKFKINNNPRLGDKKKNHITLVGPAEKLGGKPRRIELKLGKDFNPMAIGGSAKFDLPVVFVGYGITAKDEKYDDYDGIDVKGKAVLMLRKEPQQNNPHSVFEGKKSSQHAYFTRKVSNAFEHGAKAVIFINDAVDVQQRAKADEVKWKSAVDSISKLRTDYNKLKEPTPQQTNKFRKQVNSLAGQIQELAEKKQNDEGYDKVLTFMGAGQAGSHRKMPVVFVQRALFEPAIKVAFAGDSLSDLERLIDEKFAPQSKELSGWKIAGETNVISNKEEVKNVIAILEGEGPLANETVIVGAHYDHLGLGGKGSLAPWTKAIHNGADDNGSGASALLEVAHRLATRKKKPARRIVFIAFTAEERGLLGSAYYVANPRFALENTVAMVNMDMVGRLTDNKLIVYGTGTAKRFDALVNDLNKKYAFKITKNPSGFGPSDHASFYAKKIPVFHLFTGLHKDYHRPSDDIEKINFEGMRRITDMVTDMVSSIADTKERPQYLKTKRAGHPLFNGKKRTGTRPYFGSIPDFSKQVEGYALMGVAPGGPAEKAGLKAGDVVVKFAKSKIGGLDDIDSALRKYKAGDKVPVVVLRDGKKMTFTVTLDPPR